MSRNIRSASPSQIARLLTECPMSRSKTVINQNDRFEPLPCPGCGKPVRLGFNGPAGSRSDGNLEVTIPFHSDPRKQAAKTESLAPVNAQAELFLSVLEAIANGPNPEYRARLLKALAALA